MKKSIAAAVIVTVSISIASAQTDSGKAIPSTTSKEETVSFRASGKTSDDPSKDMISIPANEIPFSLRATLQASEYNGWESNGAVYQNPGTSEYAVRMNSINASSNSKPVWYRFDPNGKRIPDSQ